MGVIRTFRFNIRFFVVIAVSLVTLGGAATEAQARVLTDSGIFTVKSICGATAAPVTQVAEVGSTKTLRFEMRTGSDLLAALNGAVVTPAAFDPGDPIDTQDVVDACVYGDWSRIEGASVKMEVVSGPNVGQTSEAILGADGTTEFQITGGASTGTDTIKFSIVLPQLCFSVSGLLGSPVGTLMSDGGCESVLGGTVIESMPFAATGSRPISVVIAEISIEANASVHWIGVQARPTVTVSSIKKCAAKRAKIVPTYSPGLVSAQLEVDGRVVLRRSNESPFVLRLRKYKNGRHRFRVFAKYAEGTVASNAGVFKKCSPRR